MLKEAIEKICEMCAPEVLDKVVSGDYTSKPVFLVKELLASSVKVKTLTGLADYLNSVFSEDSGKKVYVHVENHCYVSVNSHLTPQLNRECFVVAENAQPVFQFGKFYNLEQFNINLQSQFVQTENVKLVLAVVGNVKKDSGVQVKDDGVTQRAEARTGIVRVETIDILNPVALRPYRTFVEIEQPESSFVFRLHDGSSGLEAALFEADGGAWKLEAMQNIKAWIAKNAKGYVVLA